MNPLRKDYHTQNALVCERVHKQEWQGSEPCPGYQARTPHHSSGWQEQKSLSFEQRCCYGVLDASAGSSRETLIHLFLILPLKNILKMRRVKAGNYILSIFCIYSLCPMFPVSRF